MEVGVIVNAVVIAVVGVALAWNGNGRFDAVEHRIDQVEAALKVRSDLMQSAFAFGARTPNAENG